MEDGIVGGYAKTNTSSLNPRAIGGMVNRVLTDIKNPSYGVSVRPYRETGMRGFGLYSCGGLFAFFYQIYKFMENFETPSSEKESSNIKKTLKKFGMGSLYVGGGVFMLVFSVLRFIYVAVAGLTTIYAAIVLFSNGSIIWGLVVLLIGTSLAVAIAQLLFIPVFILSVITLLVWLVAHLFGSEVGIQNIWHSLLHSLKIALFLGVGLYLLYSVFTWIRKKTGKKKLKDLHTLVYKKAFPGGQEQIQEEVEILAALFTSNYSPELIKDELLRCTFLFIWNALNRKTMLFEELVKIVSRDEKLSEYDSRIMATFLVNKEYGSKH